MFLASSLFSGDRESCARFRERRVTSRARSSWVLALDPLVVVVFPLERFNGKKREQSRGGGSARRGRRRNRVFCGVRGKRLAFGMGEIKREAMSVVQVSSNVHGQLDAQIEQLIQCKPLPEQEVLFFRFPLSPVPLSTRVCLLLSSQRRSSHCHLMMELMCPDTL